MLHNQLQRVYALGGQGFAVEQNAAVLQRKMPSQDTRQSGFAAARRPHDANGFAFGQIEAGTIEHASAVVLPTESDVTNFKHGLSPRAG